MPADIIQFLASCYRADFRAVSLLNFFSKKAGHHLLLESAELLHGELTEFPVSSKWAKEIEKTMAIYGKEKSLYCCAFFLAGAANIAGRKEVVLAPLYLYPTELLEDQGIYYVAIDIENPMVNPALVEADPDSEPGKYEALAAAVHKGYFKFGKMEELQAQLLALFPNWDASPLSQFPQLLQEDGLKLGMEKAREAQVFTFLPAVGLCLVDKPTGSRGVLNELGSMSEQQHFSLPILELLAQKWAPPQQKQLTEFHVPAVLSKTQSTILANTGRFPTQLVIGPPGTGKSFTIAALALELLSRGKSVLIASKNDEACNVVADKIERDLGIQGVVVRANKRDYKNDLQKRIQHLLDGIDLVHEDGKRLKQLNKFVRQWQREVKQLENKIEKQQSKQLVDGVFLHQYNGGFVQGLQKAWLAWRRKHAQPLWELANTLERLTTEHHVLLRNYLKASFNYQLGMALNTSRLELQHFVNAIKARTGNRKETLFGAANFKVILRTLPIWTVNTSDIHRVLPLQLEMFDLVILDEATQCDLASSMPVLQRGKSALVVGDPKQLRHLSFLSSRQQQSLGEQYLLTAAQIERMNYRDNSLLHLVSMSLPSQERVYFLQEHYRSMPDIIAFSNAQFYNNRLHVMTATPTTMARQHLFLRNLKGKRLVQGHNPVEAASILEEVQRIIESEKMLEQSICQSIGIVSPFREQVNHLQRSVEKLLPIEQIKRHRLMVGTPFSFQGEERDVVFLSLALDDASHPSAFQYLHREDVFNVSITRARGQQHIRTSFDHERLPASSLVRQYLANASQAMPPAPHMVELGEEHEFLAEIKTFLLELGLDRLLMAYPIAGVQVDFVITSKGRTYGIDIIGYPSTWGVGMQLDTWKMLYRTGMPVFFLPYSEWVLEPKKVKAALAAFLGIEQAAKQGVS